MVNRLYKLIALFLMIFFGRSASGRDIFQPYHQKNSKNTTVSADSPHQKPFRLAFTLNNTAAPVINVRQHRGAHSFQHFAAFVYNYTLRVKYLDFICGEGSGQLSRFRKLILFPFHDFW
ncbi:hypothetical protein LX99_00111 [Mucilaginibacter oryzae]|uniref:Uncharacterized protein n=1 Tax=Mucilaginibacter oryzae TaxID=468058 RepID=A0A316HHN8_9SPHI|nr:hypothetical protein [Mucilaginibacter oryzae]PWK79653.1 hypothetical protein LX99_00111 [Mucilaginibacter oryzae]